MNCYQCNTEAAEQHATRIVKWGTDGLTPYGRHIFKGIKQRGWVCPKCGEKFYDMEQMRYNELNLNEAIKAKLGIDWLAEGDAGRAGTTEGRAIK